VALLRGVVERGIPLDALMAADGAFANLDGRDRALARAIVGMALRRRGAIARALDACLDRPLKADAGGLSAILHVAAAQILFLDVADHAAVNLAVAQAAADRRARHARGLVNGVLRRLLRERESILEHACDPSVNARAWLYAGWERAWGADTAAAIAGAHLEQPPLDVVAKDDPQSWAERLGGVLLPTGAIRLAEAPNAVAELPGYEEGGWWVQDAAAALPIRLFGDLQRLRVADLCAAPGGKTAQLAAAGAHVTAVEKSPARLARLEENMARLGLPADTVCADMFEWSPGEPFDAVLLDAPCSATGTIRRHPDVQWLKRPEDILALAALQARMLDRAAELVRPGGRLVFCTCSLEPAEGEDQVAPFLARHPEFSLLRADPAAIGGLDRLVSEAGTLRTLPSFAFGSQPLLSGMDGFFAAAFARR
jgi:16S rRNA (cytosine967-C5)-methyltransferase